MVDRSSQGNPRGAFSLVELLTVIFIIALLIGILIPSLNAARNAAKKTSTASAINAVKVGLELFKNENGSEFPQSNGYPPSFSHPPLTAFNDYRFEAHEGQFPFIEGKPKVYGAHWLPAMLMGVDAQGYIKRSAVPRGSNPPEPWTWYAQNQPDAKPIQRATLYTTPENTPTRKTKDLPGRPPVDMNELFPDWDKMKELPVIVDAFDQPLLYYVASTTGKATNMVEEEHDENNNYDGGDQEKGVPFYFHQDNIGFTGVARSPTEEGTTGWDFSNSGGRHAIAFHGAALKADEIIDDQYRDSFARYIVDRKIYSHLASLAENDETVDPKTPLRPVNADSFLLISAGVDGKFGTNDDVSNIPPFEQR